MLDYASLPEDEKRWRSESDAQTLAEANVINGDGERRRRAAEAAQKMADEKAKDAAAMRNVAGRRKGNSSKQIKRRRTQKSRDTSAKGYAFQKL